MRVLKALPAGIYLTIMPQQSTQEAILESVSLQKCTPHITVIDLPRFVFSSSFTSFHFFFLFAAPPLSGRVPFLTSAAVGSGTRTHKPSGSTRMLWDFLLPFMQIIYSWKVHEDTHCNGMIKYWKGYIKEGNCLFPSWQKRSVKVY